MDRLKRVELQIASSLKSGEETTNADNSGGEVAPSPLVKKLVASV
jgi:hypothetical protein